jgi:hypothetical protein
VTLTTREERPGIAFLQPTVFFIIDYSSWNLFFDESRSDGVLKKVAGGKIWRALMEKYEQPGEYYCGIEIGVGSVRREIMSAGVLEM